MSDATPGVLVTGTDTGVGKTVVAAALCAALRAEGLDVGACKPVLTGLDEPGPYDDELLAAATGQSPDEVTALRFGPPASPHLAAELAGTVLDPDGLLAAVERVAAAHEAVVVEGVGGLRVPLAPGVDVRGIARALGYPVVVVARPALGTIHHTISVLEDLADAGLDATAVVLSRWPEDPGVVERSNQETIARLGEVPVLTLSDVALEPEALTRAGTALRPRELLGARLPVLADGDLRLRPLRGADGPPLRAMRRTTEVHRFWGPLEDGFPYEEPVARYAIEAGGRLAGLIQWDEEREPAYRRAWIDVFADPSRLGEGVGRRAVDLLSRHLLETGIPVVTIEPNAANHVAIRAYERAGFRRAGVVRRAERLPDGVLGDAVLMDRIADDLTR